MNNLKNMQIQELKNLFKGATMVGLMLLVGLLATNFGTARAQNNGTFTITAGVNDNFALPTDPTSPSPNLLGWLNSIGAQLKNFDSPQNDRFVAHTFTGLSDISEATLEIHLRAGTSFLSHNDGVNLTFIDDDLILPSEGPERWGRSIGTGHGVPGLLPYDWHSTTASPAVDTIVLDLGNLPLAPGQPASASNLIPALNAHGFLDFWLQDDTDVDYIALTVKGKMDICHIPPGNPSNAHTITVSTAAVSTHLNHGDTLGACPLGESAGSRSKR
jgi:hypothetical protein